MKQVKEKKERALGVKLFIKAERCNSPKCVMIRRPYRPGVHGQTRRRRGPSEFGKQLQEKQKIQITYGLTNKQMRNLFKGSLEKIILTLETRLDRVVYLLGFAPSSRVARQLVSHGHIFVNNKKVTVPSCNVRIGDAVSIRPQSKKNKVFSDLEIRLKKYETPQWLKLSKDELKGERVGSPSLDNVNLPFDINLVGQFYAR